MKEWLVIEDSRNHSIFRGPDAGIRGYIPRAAAEALLDRDLGGVVWFTPADSAAMRGHPEWRDDEP